MMDDSPSQRELFALFLPLALSGIFFPLALPVINAALARTAAPVLALAAYGVARGVSQPLLSPLFGLRQITTALARDRDMLRHIRNCTALLAVLALGGGQVAYLLVIWWPARELFDGRIPAKSEAVEERQRSGRYVFYFFLPLGISAVLTAIIEPALQTGMARAPLAEASLAAYPVCTSVIWLAGTPLWNVQQVVIARVRGQASFRAVRRFILVLSLGLMACMGLLALPPVAGFVFGRLIGVSGQIEALSIQGFRWMVLSPLLMGGRSLYFGTLISQDATGPIRSAAVARVGVLLAALTAGVAHGGISGLLLAVWAMLASQVAELLVLHWHVRRVVLGDGRMGDGR